MVTEALELGDKVYTPQELKRKPPHKYELPKSLYALHHAGGFQSNRRNNIFYIADDVLLYASGHALIVQNLATGKRKHIFGYDGRGIGAIAIHPSKKYFAVGEKGDFPNVYIYEYPSYKIVRCLRKGTERTYSCLTFSEDGTKLGSVGGYPDYLLTVWDWMDERIILHTKAFSQEVFNVTFSPDDPGQLCTSGTGHIRFWKMASTFTGLKLQGDIGKFGKVEMSDIEAYATLPDGKVLSGTERGTLLLWDGNFIKCELCLPSGGLCHEGEINVVQLDREAGHFLTAGVDGYLKWWDFKTIDTAEITDEMPIFEIKPKAEQLLEGIQIKTLEKGSDHWLVQDQTGGLYKVNDKTFATEKLMNFHAGAITALDSSPMDHFAATAGEDGSVRCWDYVEKQELFKAVYPAAASCLIWAPPCVDSSAKTIVVGFVNGVVRVLFRAAKEWKLMKVFKPHNGEVNALAYSNDGRFIATAGADKNVFLLKVGDSDDLSSGGESYEPVGFHNLSAEVNSLCWRSDSEAILVTCSDGSAGEVPVPDGHDDSSESFELHGEIKQFVFQRPPKSKSVKELEEELHLIENPVEPVEGEEQVEKVVEEEPPLGSALCAIYKDGTEDRNFFLSFDSSDSGAIHECSFDNEGPLDSLPETKCATSFLRYSHSKKFLVTGSVDGAVRVRSVSNPNGFLQLNFHDGDVGQINGAMTSFDDKFLLSVGSDGLFYIARIKPDQIEVEAANTEKRVQKKREAVAAAGVVAESKANSRKAKVAAANAEEDAKQQPLPDPKIEKALAIAKALEQDDEEAEDDVGFVFAMEDDVGGDESAPNPALEGYETVYSSAPSDHHDTAMESQIMEPEDIVSDDVYSIQDAKLKTEEDNRIKAAEKKKDVVRGVIKGLRAEYQALLERNEAEIPERRLDPKAFELEPDYIGELVAKGEYECHEVRKELEYASEKSELRQAKLKEQYLSQLATERIELKALKSPFTVQSFRTALLSRELEESLRAVHASIDSENASKRAAADRDQNDDRSAVKAVVAESSAEAEGPAAAAGGEGAMHNGEARKLLRQARKAKLEALEAKRPAEDAEDPRDVRAIAYAEANMGDYKLKTAENYVVPEEQRVNADKKRRQMLLLEESMHTIQMNFNRRFLSLRDLKQQIIQQIQSDNRRIDDINGELAESTDLWDPTVSDSEWPEKREEVSATDLAAYKQKLGLADEADSATAAQEEEAVAAAKEAIPAAASEDSDPVLQTALESGVPKFLVQMAKEPCTGELSTIQEAQKEARCCRLQNERLSLVEKTQQTVAMFDEAIYELRQEKLKLDNDLKAADLRMLTLYQELVLLREFETKDTALAAKMEKCRSEKDGVVTAISDFQEQLATKREEIAGWQEKDKHIMNEFNTLVGEGNQFMPQLLKIFKKRIKRAKKRTGDEDEDEEDEEDWDDDEDFDDEDEEMEDDDEEDACPPGCDQTLYDKVLELREKRLDQEEIISDFQKNIDDLTRNNERQQTREKQINKDLKQTEKEIESFQTEKQQRLNQLDVVITLKLDQLRCMAPLDPEEEGGEPEILSSNVDSSLVFGKKQLSTLKSRIKELEVENKALRQEFKNLHKEQSRLAREKKLKDAEISQSNAKCDDLQMLKFGQIIDLEALDKVSVSKTVDDLNEKIRVEELKNDRQLSTMKRNHQQYREQLLRSTQENTTLLENIAELSNRQFKLEKELNSTGGQMHVADQGPLIKNEVEERNRLVQLVKLQAKEVDALKAEINMLRRKGGHVYTPAVRQSASMPQNNSGMAPV